MLNLLGAGRQLLPSAAVHHGHFRPAAQGAPGGIHSHIAAADHHHAAGGHQRGHGAGVCGVHQVDAGEPFIGGKNAAERFARDAHKVGQAGPAAQKNGGKAALQQLLHPNGAADDGIGLQGNAHGGQGGDLLREDGFGQAEGGDAVGQHPAGGVQRLVDGDGVAHAGQLPGAGQAGRPGADYRHRDPVGRGDGGGGSRLGAVPVRHKALQPADGDAFALFAPDADGLALVFLRADPAADGGQGIFGRKKLPGGGKVALGDLRDKFRDADPHGAAGPAGRVGAAQAAAGLPDGGGLLITQRDFLKVAGAPGRGLHRHGGSGGGKIRVFIHKTAPFPAGGRRPPGRPAPDCGTDGCGGWLRQNPPDGRQIPGRPRRRTAPARPR